MGGELMQSQKIENLLNLSLEATQQEREKSIELEVGNIWIYPHLSA